jgi:hypothetical protein
MDDYDFDDDLGDLRAEVQWQRRHQGELLNNPDCRDPYHTGCEICENDPDDEEYDDE